MTEGRRPNRLATSTSPYLLSHAHNPVEWFPWGEEALARAKAEDRPLLLSIGYAACHWCHVMERESFEDEAIAAKMNETFVCVKIDREERPDVDEVYMSATIAMTGSGGWPMTVFCTPDGRPFFAGTYFPPRAKYGRPGFADLLDRVAEAWRGDRTELFAQADELTRHLTAGAAPARPAAVPVEVIEVAVRHLDRTFDPEWGGFGGAPKFPPSESLRLLLRHHARTGSPRSLEMAQTTLDRMRRGGMFDHLGGGFARYSTDARWQVPHFEKMLYDNAQLARTYLEAHQITGSADFRRVVEETLGWMVREMQLAHGGFASATDADSEGVEGRYFVFSREEIEGALGGGDEVTRFCAAYDVRPEGNWEGHNVLWMPRPAAEIAEEAGLSREALEAELATGREKLLALRTARVPPLRDDKALAAWNGLAIGALAEASLVLSDERWRAAAERAADFVLGTLGRPDGGLFRTHRAGTSQLGGYLEDYAFVADALIDLYEASGRDRWLLEAERLARRMLADFGDEATGAFFHTAHDHEVLLVRSRDGADGALPAANAAAARTLSRLSIHLGDPSLGERASRAIAAHGAAIRRAPRAFASTLRALEDRVEPAVEIALVGPAEATATRALLAVVARTYLPNRALARHEPEAPLPSARPLLAGRLPASGEVASAFVCRDFVCRAPTSSPEELAASLSEARGAAYAARERAVRPTLRPGRATPEGIRRGAREGAVEILVGDLPLPRLVLAPRASTRDLEALIGRAYAAGVRVLAIRPEVARRAGAALDAMFTRGDLPGREGLVVLVHLDAEEAAEAAARAESAADLLELATVDGVVLDAPVDLPARNALEDLSRRGRVGALGLVARSGPLRALRLIASDEVTTVASGDADRTLVLGALEASLRGRAVRLDAPTAPEAGPSFEASRSELRALESEFRETVAAHLQAPEGSELDPAALLAFGEALGPLPAELGSVDEVDAFVADALQPALGAATSALDDLPGPLGQRWRGLRTRYLPALEAAVSALRARVGGRARADADVVLRLLDPHLPARLRSERPVVRALALALATPGADLVVADLADPEDAQALEVALASPRFDTSPARAALG